MDEFGTQTESPMTPPSTGAPGLVGQWSWAGFMFNWLYLIGHNVVGLGIALVIAMVVAPLIFIWIPIIGPILVLLVDLAIALFVAIKGHELAWNSGTFKTSEEFMAAQRVMNTMGKVWFFVTLVLTVIWILIALIAGATALTMLGGAGGAGGLEGAFPSG